MLAAGDDPAQRKQDAKLIRDKTGNSLSMTYEARKSFIYNIDFVVKFSYAVPLGSKTAGD